MAKNILIVSGSPKKDGNTSALIEWFSLGAAHADTTVINAAFLTCKVFGCTSCRLCQKRAEWGCVIEDGASDVLKRMIAADVIVLATPLYFFAPSAQLKAIIDRMFSLYKWDNATDTMQSALKGKGLVLLASSYEELGMDLIDKPFKLLADYTGMSFDWLLVPDAGTSGEIRKKTGVRERTIEFGKKISSRS